MRTSVFEKLVSVLVQEIVYSSKSLLSVLCIFLSVVVFQSKIVVCSEWFPEQQHSLLNILCMRM